MPLLSSCGTRTRRSIRSRSEHVLNWVDVSTLYRVLYLRPEPTDDGGFVEIGTKCSP